VEFLNGSHWQEQRRFSLKTLRDMGFGKDGMEALITDEAQRLCDELESHHQEPIQVKLILILIFFPNIV